MLLLMTVVILIVVPVIVLIVGVVAMRLAVAIVIAALMRMTRHVVGGAWIQIAISTGPLEGPGLLCRRRVPL